MQKPLPRLSDPPSASVHVSATSVSRQLLNSQTYIPELDGIRGLAILLVFFYHMFSLPMRHQVWHGGLNVFKAAVSPGWLGVNLFFILSGFLITGILLDGKGQPYALRTFYVKRALRILPLYYLVLFAIWVFWSDSSRYVLICFLYLANFAPMMGIRMINTPLWSLSVEEHFYIVWPWIVNFTKQQTVVLIAAATVLAEPIVRLLSYPRDVYFQSYYRFDELALGALIACFYRSGWYSPRNVIWFAGTVVGAAAAIGLLGIPGGLYVRDSRMFSSVKYTPVDLLFFAFVLLSIEWRGWNTLKPLRSRPLRFVGDISYCLYLIHMMIADGYDHFSGFSEVSTKSTFPEILTRALIVAMVSVPLASLSGKYFEMPIRRSWKTFVPGKPARGNVR